MEASHAAAVAIAKEKEMKELLKEKEKEKEKEREREGEMEAALYSNCLLLGLDAAVLGHNVGARVGLFKHSNPRVGEALLHFLLCALRGPSLSAKDFAGVWPIFDAAQSREFRRIVQSLINELEAQGALPRSNSRVSSLATCCGQRFVELLWQLSAHALREVHKRSFPTDVAANPLPASLTEVVSQNSHAASLLPVTKARIALERRRFLEGATSAVRRQALWSNLANDLTAEFRALCAEEAYLHQELDKMHELQDSKARIYEGAMADDEALSVETATELWESLLQHTEQHEKLGSGPVEDLIAHREHRYRIDGSSLRTAIDRGSTVLPTEANSEDLSLRTRPEDDVLQRPSSRDGSRLDSFPTSSEGYAAEESRGRGDERSSKAMAQLDVAEILRRWTHALHRLHKQALRLAKANDGAGPELLKDAMAVAENGHSQSLHATLAEHKQHLANMQALVGQLKDSIPGMEAAVAALREQVNSTDAVTACIAAQSSLSTSPFPPGMSHSRKDGQDSDDLNRREAPPLELVPPSPALKLPQLLSTSPTSMDKVARLQKRFNQFAMVHPLEALREEDVMMGSSIAGSSVTEDGSDAGDESIMSLRQAVREAALAHSFPSQEISIDRYGHPSTEHYFTPIAQNNSNRIFEDKKVDVVFGKQRRPVSTVPRTMSVQPSVDISWKATEDLKRSIKPDSNKDSLLQKIDRPASPPLLMELSTFDDTYDDLLAPMSELDMLH
ncbi:HAUS augmin-like complex subunit 6 [Marchantia polymorpha subsp. ruderalis]|uniref:HAUS augmin-like complex subunit 6 N-terminal domain-containing protein n=2 Tax=Marchantia polymorpha TaxID=3197 RepID=A0A176VRE5_MARPO|nr:hypothetical protein AXG93_961s1270 [Marchantia polymorpha subsp. ruderalis]PTQ41840.1 hypothetical protein MARPO_0032s0042 [Marchantia polymorpha]BBN11626.1 hypothetical protein Mp_5g13490 [Marchantia polymorpha subsp. ruderalis]|eukprot:PTQ41840.1 hypothetical protein MARPO_0032s0042 [Marchantia polymorpha]